MESINTGILTEKQRELPRYSFSKISSFLHCRYGFFKHYFNGEEGISHGTSEFGGFCHNILEKFEKGELNVYDLSQYYIDNYNKEITSDFTLKMSEDFSKDFAGDYYDSGKKYFENFEGFNDFEILEAEYEFEEVINDLFIFNGKIDLVALDKNGDLVIIDHKSKARFKSKAELKEYARQLYLYSYATYKKYGKFPKQMMFNRFRKNEWTIIDFKQEDYEEALNWAVTNVEEIESTFDFYPNCGDFFSDNFCAFRNVCPIKNGEDIES